MSSVIQALIQADLSKRRLEDFFQDTQGRTHVRTTLYLLGSILAEISIND